ncbi:MAG: disulfide bond formation protein B [Pseudomonadales bacterium]|nr:disulfide bond formation protein B [Pseudomonadales bacterium]
MTVLTAPRQLNLIAFLFCTTLILTAFYFQYIMGLEPCPLCMAQRIAFYASGIIFLIAAIHNPTPLGQRIYASLTLFFSLGGMALASRQLWLQSLPEDQVPACGPGLEYMMEVLPWAEIVSVMLRGTGDCAKVQWTFLSLSIPGWTFIAFLSLVIISLMLFKRRSI